MITVLSSWWSGFPAKDPFGQGRSKEGWLNRKGKLLQLLPANLSPACTPREEISARCIRQRVTRCCSRKQSESRLIQWDDTLTTLEGLEPEEAYYESIFPLHGLRENRNNLTGSERGLWDGVLVFFHPTNRMFRGTH